MSLLRLGPLRAYPLRRAFSTTPRALSKNRPNADAPVNETADVDPAARGVNEMRRQWGGLIDDAESQLADEAAASKGEKKSKNKELKVDMGLHEGLEAEETGDVDPAARGVNEMRRQWGGLIDKKW